MIFIFFYFISTPRESDNIRPFIVMERIKYWFMGVSTEILYIFIKNMKILKYWCLGLCYKMTGRVGNFNYAHDINVLYPYKSVSKFSMMFSFWLMNYIFCPWYCSNDLLLMHRYFSIWEPIIYQSFLEIKKPKKGLINMKIYVSFLYFDLKSFS